MGSLTSRSTFDPDRTGRMVSTQDLGAATQAGGLGNLKELLNLVSRYRKGPADPVVTNGGTLKGQDPYEMANRNMDMQMKAAQVNALTHPAPMKQNYMAGTTGPFLTMDTDAMNAFQRQAYLPQNANFFDPSKKKQDDDNNNSNNNSNNDTTPKISILDAIRMYNPSLFREMLKGGGGGIR